MRPAATAIVLTIFALATTAAFAEDGAPSAAPSSAEVGAVVGGKAGAGTGTEGEMDLVAELTRRDGDSWVITHIVPTAASEATAGEAAPLSEAPGVQRTMHAYRTAVIRGDIDQLQEAWVLNPAEREQMRSVIARPRRVSLEIIEPKVIVDGEKATVFFRERRRVLNLAEERTRQSRRGVAAYDSAGSWRTLRTR